jgi:hypothetical protein
VPEALQQERCQRLTRFFHPHAVKVQLALEPELSPGESAQHSVLHTAAGKVLTLPEGRGPIVGAIGHERVTDRLRQHVAPGQRGRALHRVVYAIPRERANAAYGPPELVGV